jgi:hypothetical protein
MTLRKFRDLLEPLRVRRSWARDDALRRVGQLRRELQALKANEIRLASEAGEQAHLTQTAWSGAPHPAARLAAVSWLAAHEAQRLAAQREVVDGETRLAQAIAHWERASAALEAVEKQTQRDRAAHAHAAQVQAQAQADAEWLARGESA